jgi:hypothetical protein
MTGWQLTGVRRGLDAGRLAMMAMLGFYGQAAATGTGPIDNWLAHLASPFTTTVASNAVAVPFL